MSEHDSSAGSGSSTPEWDQARQRYWQTWMDLARRGLDPDSPLEETAALDEWVETLRHWWEISTPELLRTDPELFYKLLAQGLGYLVFSERALHLIRGLDEAAREERDWRGSLSRSLDMIRATLIDPTGGSPSGLATCWGLPLSTWKRVVTELTPSPPARDREEDPRAAQLWQAYQEARQAYAQLLRQAAQRALADLQARLEERAQRQEPITTLRGFYNLWVETSETAYGEALRSEDYSQVFGRLINTLLHLKAHGRQQSEASLRRLDIPTRSELDGTHARVAELRRRLDRLEEQEAVAELLAGLRQEIQQLRQEVAELKSRSVPSAMADGEGTDREKSS